MTTLGRSNVWEKKDVILKNKAEKLLITKVWPPKTNRNKPKNKAGKLLKKRTCRKNKPKNKPTDVVENKEGLKNEPERNLPILSSVTGRH